MEINNTNRLNELNNVNNLDQKYSDADILKLIEDCKEADAICKSGGFDILYLRYRTQQISRKQRRYIRVENLYKESFSSSVSPFVNTEFWHMLQESRLWEQIERERHSKRILEENKKKNPNEP